MNGALVRLRAMEPRDAEAQHRWFNDPEVTRWLAVRYPVSAQAIAQRLEGAAAMTFAGPRFSVERLDTDELVGYVALRDVTPESRNAELDLVMADPAAFADAAETACRFAFERMGLHRVHAWVFAAHSEALAAYESVGFVREGVARDRWWRRGAWHDGVLMARLAP